MRKLYKSKVLLYLLTLLMVFSSIPMERVLANENNYVDEEKIIINDLEKDELIDEEEIIDDEVIDDEKVDDEKSEEDNVTDNPCLLNKSCILTNEHDGDCQLSIDDDQTSNDENIQDLGTNEEKEELPRIMMKSTGPKSTPESTISVVAKDGKTETNNAETLTAIVNASAPINSMNTYFYLHTNAENAVMFDDADTIILETSSGDNLTLLKSDSGYYFVLDNSVDSSATEFELSFNASDSKIDASYLIYSGMGDSLDSAKAVAQAKQDADVALTWKKTETINKSLALEVSWASYPSQPVHNLVDGALTCSSAEANSFYVKYILNIRASGKYQEGEIEVRVPYGLYRDYNSTTTNGPLEMSLSSSKFTEIQNTCFSCKIDNKGTVYNYDDEIIISNLKEVEAVNTEIPFKYMVTTSGCTDMEKYVIQAEGTIKNYGEVCATTYSNTISYQFDSGFKLNEQPLIFKGGILNKTQAGSGFDFENNRYVRYEIKVDYLQKNQGTMCTFAFANIDGYPQGELVSVKGMTYISLSSTSCSSDGVDIQKNEDNTWTVTTGARKGDLIVYLDVKYPKAKEKKIDYKANIHVDVKTKEYKYFENNIYDSFSADITPEYNLVVNSQQKRPVFAYIGDGNMAALDILKGNEDLLAKVGWQCSYDGNFMDKNEKQQIELTNEYIFLNEDILLSADDYEISNINGIKVYYDAVDDDIYESREFPPFEGGYLVISGYNENGWKNIKEYWIEPKLKRTNQILLEMNSEQLKKDLGELLAEGHYSKIRILTPEVGRGKLWCEYIFEVKIKGSSPEIQEYFANNSNSSPNIYPYAFFKHYNICDGIKTVDNLVPYNFEYSNGITSKEIEDALKEKLSHNNEGLSDPSSDSLYFMRNFGIIRIEGAKYKSAIDNREVSRRKEGDNEIIKNFLYAGEGSTLANGSEKLAIFNDFCNKEGVFYILLPKGYSFKAVTKVDGLHVDSASTAELTGTPRVIDNWKNTGKQLAIVSVKPKDGLNNWARVNDTDSSCNFKKIFPRSYWEQYATGFRIEYEVFVTKADSIYTQDLDYTLVAYQNGKKIISGGSSDDGSPKSQPFFASVTDESGNPVFQDINGNGIYPEENTTLYHQLKTNPTTFDQGATESSMIIDIKKGTNTVLGYSKNCEINRGGQYSYRITIDSSSTNTMSDLVVYNILEDASEDGIEETWKGKVQSIDVSTLENNNIDAIVYYSTLNPKQLSYYQNANTTLPIRTSEWLDEEIDGKKIWNRLDNSTDYNKITAIAVDLRKDKDGNPHIFSDGKPYYFTIVMNAPDTIDGKCYSGYALNRAAYSCRIGSGEETGVLSGITKAYIENVTARGKKVWDDKYFTINDYYPKRPDYITVNLLADGIKVDEKIVRDSDNWQWEFGYLDKFNAQGEEIYYTFSEESVEDYTFTYRGNALSKEGATIENDYDKQNLIVKILWRDGKTDSERGIYSVPLTLMHTYENLSYPIFDYYIYSSDWINSYNYIAKLIGDENQITLNESDVPQGYTYRLDVDKNENAITVTITYILLGETVVAKSWTGDEGHKGKRPSSIDVMLYQTNSNKEPLGTAIQTMTIAPDAEGNWKCAFTDIPLYDKDGNVVKYVVREKDVLDYTASYKGSVEEGFEIINTYSPKPPKDDSDDDDDEPDATPIVPVPTPYPIPQPEPTPEPDPVPEPTPDTDSDDDDDGDDDDNDTSGTVVLPSIITSDFGNHIPEVGLEAAVLGARRALDCAVLGKRRQPGTGDDISLFLWLGLFIFGFVSTAGCGILYSKNKRKDGNV